VGFKGMILVAPFIDAIALAETYKIAGLIPILSPLVNVLGVYGYLISLLRDTWMSGERISSFICLAEEKDINYRITIIHTEDDLDVPFTHSSRLFEGAVNATTPLDIRRRELDGRKADVGNGGSVTEWKSESRFGVLREEILKTGLHDLVMGYSVIGLAVLRIFDSKSFSKGYN
jgi:abhydrolase domain-containing protein 12